MLTTVGEEVCYSFLGFLAKRANAAIGPTYLLKTIRHPKPILGY
jgi:hypothetical protein